MFMADEAIGAQYSFRRMADTSRVYAPILAKYGYTVDDFHASEEKYIKDAGRYARIIKKSVRLLEAENKILVKERDRVESIRLRAERQLRFRPHRLFLLDTLKEEYMRDSLFNFDFQLGLDTVFAGPRIIVSSDTLVRDTVKVTKTEKLSDDKVVPEEIAGGKSLTEKQKIIMKGEASATF